MRADRRMATILFADLVDSTRFLTTSDPEEARIRLSARLAAMCDRVQAFGGTVCQVLGDGIFAIFGAPLALEDHAARACMAAAAVAAEATAAGDPVRVGLCSGEILWEAASPAYGHRPPAVGLAVNIAAKLQAAAPVNGVRLAASTADLAAGWIEVEAAGAFAVGAGDRLPTFTLRRILARRRRTVGTPLLGRDGEQAALAAMLDATVDSAAPGRDAGRGGVCFLVGPAGIGKTRLIQAAMDMAAARGVRIIEWDVNPVRPVGAPTPLQDLVAGLIGQGGAVQPGHAAPLPGDKAQRDRILRDRGLGDAAADALSDILHPMGRGDDQHRPPPVRLAQAAGACADLLARAAAERPTLLVVDDMDRAGSEAAAVFRALAAAPGGALIIAAARDVGTALPHDAIRLPLGPLGPAAAEGLLASVFDAAPGPRPPDRLRRRLIERAGGNPCFLLELARAAVCGAVTEDSVPESRVPDALKALLAQRIDRLPDGERTVLMHAAVLGQTFDAGLLGRLLGTAAGDLSSRLDRLVDSGLLDTTRIVPRREYAFSVPLLREAAYETLARGERRRIHRAVCALLARPDCTDPQGRLAALARHSHQGELWSTAVDACRRAGLEAFARCQASEGVELLRRAVDAHGHLPPAEANGAEGFALRMTLARSLMMQGDPAGVVDALGGLSPNGGSPEDTARTDETMDCGREAAMRTLLASANLALGRFGDALACARTAAAASARIDPSGRPHAEVLALLAAILIEKGDFLRADTTLREAATTLATGGQARRQYLHLDAELLIALHTARCAVAFGRIDRGRDLFRQARARLGGRAGPVERICFWTFLAEAAHLSGDMGRTRRAAEAALRLVARTGARMFEAYALGLSGAATAALGAPREGLGRLEAALRRCADGAHAHEGALTLLLADTHERLGDIRRARAAGERALATGLTGGADGVAARALALLARCALAEGDTMSAASLAAAAHARARVLGLYPVMRLCTPLLSIHGRTANHPAATLALAGE